MDKLKNKIAVILGITTLAVGGVDLAIETPQEAGLSSGEVLSREAPVLTSKEMDIIQKDKKLTRKEDFVLRNVINHKKLQADPSKISIEEIQQMYLDILWKLGDNKKAFLEDHLANGNNTNLDKRIRDISQKEKSLLVNEK